MKKEKDNRIGQKVLATWVIEDKGQDFTELDVLENGVILGNSPIFSHGRVSVLGVGSNDGIKYYTFVDLKNKPKTIIKGLLIYLKDTESKKDPLPWNAKTLNYKIIGMKKVVKQNRFIKK